MKKLIMIALLLALPVMADAKGGSVGGARVSAPRVSAPKMSTSTPKTSTSTSGVKTSTPSAPKVSTKPSSATAVKTAPAKSIGGKTYSSKGYVVGKDYSPKFKGGYVAPEGSVVQYRNSGFMDWLPFYLIMSSNNAHREAVVTQPDGKEEIVKEEGIDTMYVINWIITILFIGGIIVGIIYLVNKLTKKEEYAY